MPVADRRERERLQRRQCILDAARRVFDDKGIAAATMNDVAREAELSKGTLYLYFKSKDELFMELASCVLDQVLEALRSRAGSQATGRAEFRELLTCYASVALANANAIRNGFIWLALGDQVDTSTHGFAEYRDRVHGVVSVMMTAIARGQSDHSIRTDYDPQTLMSQVWGSLVGTLVLRINVDELQRRFPENINRDAIVPGAIELMCDGLVPKAVENE